MPLLLKHLACGYVSKAASHDEMTLKNRRMARNLVHMSCYECCVICIKILNAPKYPKIQLFTNIILQFLDTVLYLVKIKGDKSDQLVIEKFEEFFDMQLQCDVYSKVYDLNSKKIWLLVIYCCCCCCWNADWNGYCNSMLRNQCNWSQTIQIHYDWYILLTECIYFVSEIYFTF